MEHGEPDVVTTERAFLGAAEDAPPTARVPVEARVLVEDPFVAYRRARRGVGAPASADPPVDTDAQRPRRSDATYLETTGGQSGWGYFAVDPVSRLQVGPDLTALGTADPSPTLAELTVLLDRETLVRGECDVPYPCGAFGWLSYEVTRELESLPETTADDRGLPNLQLAVFDRVAAWKEPRPDDGACTLRVTACPRIDDHDDPSAAYEHGRERALALARAAVEGDPATGSARVREPTATFESDCTLAEFADRVRRVKGYIRDGDTFQANVSQRLRAPAAVHPVEAFAALRRVNPAPYSALLEFPGVDLVSASPELLLDVEGDRLLTEPIAGTRPRGDTEDEDDYLEADLLGDEKERAEHAMLVDLERNDLGKVSRYGTVEVSEYRRVDRYSEVMHLVSLVEGRLAEGYDLADAVAAVFPGGTITGAPKPRTMEIIDEVETTRRGPYTGSIGVFGFDDRATLNIVIRTLVRRDEAYFLRVGAGIVHDSVPEREYEETLDKGRALVRALDEALGERTDLAVEDSEVKE